MKMPGNNITLLIKPLCLQKEYHAKLEVIVTKFLKNTNVDTAIENGHASVSPVKESNGASDSNGHATANVSSPVKESTNGTNGANGHSSSTTNGHSKTPTRVASKLAKFAAGSSSSTAVETNGKEKNGHSDKDTEQVCFVVVEITNS